MTLCIKVRRWEPGPPPVPPPLKFDKLRITDPDLYVAIKSKTDMEYTDKRKRQSFMTGASSENIWKIMNK